ncbi:MAG: hypothetical protein QXD04_03580 [Candidatus Bathyarchaeia archaeon]|nr:hypothetical protein [Candidatus Bathyarchaeota archaeon]
MDAYRPLTLLGLIFIVSGIILVALPFILRHMPSLERLPWILVFIYRKNGFYFATSPLLIMISIASLIIYLSSRFGG